MVFEMNRTKSAAKNSLVSFLSQIVWLIGGFGLQIVFVRMLSAEYVGANGLFNNLMGFLAFAELGLGTAFTFSFFSPLANNDWETTRKIMLFLKKTFNAIGLVVVVGGGLIAVFLPLLVKDGQMIPHMQLLFILFILGQAATYFFGYLRTFLMATSNMYLNTINQTVFKLIQYVLQILFLVVLKSYLLYLLTVLVMNVISNFRLSKIVNKYYPELSSEKHPGKVPAEVFETLKRNVVGNVSSKLGTVVVNGTDNLLLSKFLGLALVGHYTSYYIFSQGLYAIFGQIISGVLPSLGHLGATEDKNSQYSVYQNMVYGVAGFSTVLVTSFYAVIDGVVKLFFGSAYTLPKLATLTIALNLGVASLRLVNINFISALGLFWHLRYKAIVEAASNLVISFVLVSAYHMGVAGVMLGTILSNLLVNFIWEPYILFRHGFEMPLWLGLRKSLFYHAILFINLGFILIIHPKTGDVFEIILTGFATLLGSIALWLIFTSTSDELRYYITKIRYKLKR